VTVVAAMAVIVAVGFSRIALGAHYFTDVVAAILIGTVWLGVCTLLIEVVKRNRRQAIEVEAQPR